MATTLEGSAALGARDFSLLLAPLQRSALDCLAAAMEAVMRRADDFLFDRSGQAADGAELTAVRDLRRARAQITQRFSDVVLTGFRRLLGEVPQGQHSGELSLLSEDALEEQIAADQMVDSLNHQHVVALELLEQRLAMVLGRSSLELGENPSGPAFLADAIRNAVHAVDLSTALRITLYKFMERELSTALTPLYDRMNASLTKAGILPHRLPSASGQVERAPAPLGQVGRAPPLSGQVEQRAPADDAIDTPTAGSTTPGPTDQALFSSLLGLLQDWRRRMTAPDADANANSDGGMGHQLGVPEMMSVLSLMQTDPSAVLDQVLADDRTSLAEQLRREVLAGARRLGIGGGNLRLSNVHEDAFDLVGMLFDVLLDERDFEPVARHKIGRMLVPYVKVAVKDKRLFLYKGHPARRFLNAVTEACEGNHGEGPQERALLDRVDLAIDRLVAEFNEDVAIFETLEQELRAFMAQHRQRIEIAERRASETQRGRERLEQACGQAGADIARRRGARVLPPVMDDYLTRYVMHHLTQVALRAGVESERYVQSVETLHRTLVAWDQAQCGTPPENLSPLDRPGMIEILSSSGCVGAAAEEMVDMIQRSLCQLASDGTSQAHVGLPSRESIAHEPVLAVPLLEIVGGHDRLDFDPAVAERMRALEIGTWLQLTGESGRTEPAKVSWISPISSRFLFVNRRGARILVASAEELAAMSKQGRVQLRQCGSAFEDALHQVLGRLESRTEAA